MSFNPTFFSCGTHILYQGGGGGGSGEGCRPDPLLSQKPLLSWTRNFVLDDPKKFSCLIKRKMSNKGGIFKIKIVLNYQ